MKSKFKINHACFKVEGIAPAGNNINGIGLLFYIKIKDSNTLKDSNTFSYLSLFDFCKDMRAAVEDNTHSSDTVITFDHWNFYYSTSEAIYLNFIPVRSTNNIKAPISSIAKILKEYLELSDFFEIFNEIKSFLSEHYIDNNKFLEVINCILDNMSHLLTDEEKLFLEVNTNL